MHRSTDLLPRSQALARNAVVCWLSEKAKAAKATLATLIKLAPQFDSWPPTAGKKAVAPGHIQTTVGHGATAATVSVCVE